MHMLLVRGAGQADLTAETHTQSPTETPGGTNRRSSNNSKITVEESRGWIERICRGWYLCNAKSSCVYNRRTWLTGGGFLYLQRPLLLSQRMGVALTFLCSHMSKIKFAGTFLGERMIRYDELRTASHHFGFVWILPLIFLCQSFHYPICLVAIFLVEYT